MVGHKKNANILVQELEKCGAKSISRTEFCQGNTTRWGIAWTFCQNVSLPSPKILVNITNKIKINEINKHKSCQFLNQQV